MRRTKIIVLVTIAIALLCLTQFAKATAPEATGSESNPEDPVSDEQLDAYEDDAEAEADLDALDSLDDDDDEDDKDDDGDDDIGDLDGDEDDDSIEHDWKKVLETTLANKDAYHNKDTILHLAYAHLIYEEVDALDELRLKHSDKDKKLDEEESASLSNAMVVKAYIDEKFGDRTEISNDEAIMILNTERYDAWMDEMPDHVINLLDEYMPDEEGDL